MKIIYLAWGKISERTKILSKILKIPVFVFKDRPPYIKALIKTIALFFRINPKIVILQTTQGPAVLTIVFLKLIKRFKLVLDIHPNFLVYTNVKGILLNRFFRNFIKYADVVLSHDYTITEIVPCGKTAKHLVLIDPPPTVIKKGSISKVDKLKLPKGKRLTLVLPSGTVSIENIKRLISVVSNCNVDLELYITGPHARRKIGKVIFTGFLSEEEYFELLNKADLIISWAERKYTVTRSSLEAIYLEKPLIVPDTFSFRKMFMDSAIYLTDIDRLCNTLQEMDSEKLENLRKKACSRAEILRKLFNKQLEIFKETLGELNG
ncbi:MAG: hypothetical protein ACTSSP_06915 [Candidatus Asgardarchaeia archaeon]